MEKLNRISWEVSEDTYREDSALSYSIISRYLRDGFGCLDRLFDKVETPSLAFGSAVDAIITGGMNEFNKKFIINSLPIDDETFGIFKNIYNTFEDYPKFTSIPVIQVSQELKNNGFWPADKWSDEKRYEGFIKKLKGYTESVWDYCRQLANKTALSQETYQDVLNCVESLKNSKSTYFYFQPDNPFDERWSREYQLKFKATFDNVDYRCMADLLFTDNENKIVYPVDLKTSGKTEYEFFKSFVEWNYQLQARLYWKIIRYNMDEDEVFKDYKLADYRFIVVNRKSLTPLVWEFPQTRLEGTLYYGRNKQIEMRDPLEVGKELAGYLKDRPLVPNGIEPLKKNNLETWLNTL